MRFASLVAILSLILLLPSSFAEAQTSTPTVDVRGIVDQALQDYVRQSGPKLKGVTGVGSWIEGTRYRNPLISPDPSDHDMTPVFDSTDQRYLRKEWKRMQNFMRDDIRQRLLKANPKMSSAEMKRVMRSVNIYPPEQLVADVIDEKEAVQRFSKLGAKPNLGGAPVEGIWGKAKKPFTQAYAESTGRTYFKDPSGVVRKGFTDLDNLAVGYGKFSLEATNDLCEQFAKKAKLAMAEGRGADALKNLKRLDQYLRKAKNASGLTGFNNMNPELLRAITNAEGLDAKDAKTMSSWLRENEGLLYKGLNRADDQLMWLKEVAGLDDVAKLEFIKDMSTNKMAKFMSWAKELQSKLNRAAGTGKTVMAKVPWNKVFKAAVALGVAIEMYNAASLYQEYGWEGANQSLSLAVINVIPSNILGQVMLDYATSVGYDLMSGSQGCLNLMAGIYEVKGRQHLAKGEQIKDLAKRCVDESCVASAVNKHAEEASHKQVAKESVAGRKGAKAIKARLTSQCLPVVLKAWKQARYALVSQVIRDKNKIDKMLSRTSVVLETNMVRSGKEVEIRARPRFQFSLAELLSLLRRMEADLKLLGGPERLGRLDVGENYEWSVEVYSYAQDRWLPKQQLPLRARRIYPSAERARDMADVEEFKLRLPAGPRYRVVLKWHLTVVPGLSADLAWRAPEVDQFRNLLKGSYSFRAQAPMDTAQWRLTVAGPVSLAADTPGKLKAVIKGSPPWAGEPGFATKISWLEGRSLQPIGSGPELAIQGPAKGQATYTARIMGTLGGQPASLAEASIVISGLEPAWLRFVARDKHSGREVSSARWRVSGPSGFSARRTGAVLQLGKVTPGRYLIEVSAPDYQTIKGHLEAAEGKRYNKVAPLQLLEKQAATASLRMTARDAKSGQTLSGARWSISGPDGFAGRQNGVLSLETARPGRYQIQVSAPGYQTRKGHITLAQGNSYDKVVALQPLEKQAAPPPPQVKAKAPAAPAGPCEWRELAARKVSGPSGTVPGKSAPPAGKYSLSIPGPGTVNIKTTITGHHQVANHRYGANRFGSVLRWSCPDGSCKKGRMRVGSFYPGVVNIGKGAANIRVNKAGALNIKIWGESCYRSGKDRNGKAACYGCCEPYGKFGTIMLPVTITMKVKFKPECPKRRR